MPGGCAAQLAGGALDLSDCRCIVPGVIVNLGRLAAADVVEDESAATDGSQLRVTPTGITDAMLVELALGGLDVVVDEGDGYAVVLQGVESEIIH
jgi:hypothetical protein